MKYTIKKLVKEELTAMIVEKAKSSKLFRKIMENLNELELKQKFLKEKILVENDPKRKRIMEKASIALNKKVKRAQLDFNRILVTEVNPKPEEESDYAYNMYLKGLGPEADEPIAEAKRIATMKLKNLLSETRELRDGAARKAFFKNVQEYANLGKEVYRSHKLAEIAENVSKMCEAAEYVTLTETEDWFDKVSVKRDMKIMKEASKLFGNTTNEMQKMQQRLESLYEEIGIRLGKYYNINDGLDPIGKEDADVDNDGDTDASDEYLKKKRAAITKAVEKQKNEARAIAKFYKRSKKENKMNKKFSIKEWQNKYLNEGASISDIKKAEKEYDSKTGGEGYIVFSLKPGNYSDELAFDKDETFNLSGEDSSYYSGMTQQGQTMRFKKSDLAKNLGGVALVDKNGKAIWKKGNIKEWQEKFSIKGWQGKYLNEGISSSDFKNAIKILDKDLDSGSGEGSLGFTLKGDMKDEYGDGVFVLQGYKSGEVEAFSEDGASYYFKEKELIKNLDGLAVNDGDLKTLFKKGNIREQKGYNNKMRKKKKFSIKEWQNKHLNEGASSSDWNKAMKIYTGSEYPESGIFFALKDGDYKDRFDDYDSWNVDQVSGGKVTAYDSEGDGVEETFKLSDLLKNLDGVLVMDEPGGNTIFEKGNVDLPW